MDKEMKVMLRNNIIKFVIGIGLLTVCFIYLGKHPAEKSSVLSWFEVMYQKAQILVHKVMYDDVALLEKKHNLQKYYIELIRTAEDGKCTDASTLTEMKKNYQWLKDMHGQIEESKLAPYIREVYKFDSSIKETCN